MDLGADGLKADGLKVDGLRVDGLRVDGLSTDGVMDLDGAGWSYGIVWVGVLSGPYGLMG